MKSVFDDELQHHGILGQKWGVRRYQNKDGSLTSAGERRYGVNTSHTTSMNNGTGAVKPSGARNKKYILSSASANKRGSGLGTGPVGSTEGTSGNTHGRFSGGGAGHSFGTDDGHFSGGGGGHSFANAHTGGGGSASESGGARRDKEPKPIGSDEWWEWYENTDDRKTAETHYNMVIAEQWRDDKRQKRGVERQRMTEHKKEMSKDLVDRKKLVNKAAKTVKKAANSVVSAVSSAADAGKNFVSKLFGGKG